MASIELRNVPDDVYQTLEARAANAGMSLSDFVLRDVLQAARLPTPDELDARIRARPAATVTTRDILAARDDHRRC